MPASTPANPLESAGEPLGYCLNTSTIRGAGLSIERELEVAAEAGFQAVEPWIEEIEQYMNGGGTLRELRRRIDDLACASPAPWDSPNGSSRMSHGAPPDWNG
jgi:hypothetical protein